VTGLIAFDRTEKCADLRALSPPDGRVAAPLVDRDRLRLHGCEGRAQSTTLGANLAHGTDGEGGGVLVAQGIATLGLRKRLEAAIDAGLGASATSVLREPSAECLQLGKRPWALGVSLRLDLRDEVVEAVALSSHLAASVCAGVDRIYSRGVGPCQRASLGAG
jgi:hypothetical protein